MKSNKRIKDESIFEVQKHLSEGKSIREAARLSKVSYYSAWHISKGSYEKEDHLGDYFKKKENTDFFSWKNFEVF